MRDPVVQRVTNRVLSMRSLCLLCAVLMLASRSIGSIDICHTDPYTVKNVTMRTEISIPDVGYYTTFTCEHPLSVNGTSCVQFYDTQQWSGQYWMYFRYSVASIYTSPVPAQTGNFIGLTSSQVFQASPPTIQGPNNGLYQILINYANSYFPGGSIVAVAYPRGSVPSIATIRIFGMTLNVSGSGQILINFPAFLGLPSEWVFGIIYIPDNEPNIVVDLDIEGLSEATEVVPGARIPRSFDANNAPRTPVTLRQVSRNVQANIVLNNPGDGLRVWTAASGGQALQFNGIDNRFQNSQLPITFYVEGITASSAEGDRSLVAQLEGSSTVWDGVTFSIVWVEIALRHGSQSSISPDNGARQNFINLTGTDKLGFMIHSLSGALGVEFRGSVSPSDRTEPLRFERLVLGAKYYLRGGLRYELGYSSDTSEPEFRDDLPRSNGSNGQIYDLDAPGVGLYNDIPGEVDTARVNFMQWVYMEVGTQTVRVSPYLNWYLRINVSPDAALNYHLDNRFVGDNIISVGQTTLGYAP